VSFATEFSVVELVLDSEFETRGIDAFALSVIKAERQMRRLFTYLVYQSPTVTAVDIPALRAVLGASRRVYFEGFQSGINNLLQTSIRELIGAGFDELNARMSEAIEVRNKIFHGQLTDRWLSTSDLLEYVAKIRRWCELLATSALHEIGYDGFMRNSFQKSEIDISHKLQRHIAGVAGYKEFLATYVER
jgi:hypothetical protein